MSNAAARLPQELWSRVLGFCLEPHESGSPLNVCAASRQPTLVSALRVNSVSALDVCPLCRPSDHAGMKRGRLRQRHKASRGRRGDILSQMFFLAAVPHLYSAPSVRHDLPAFLPGAERLVDEGEDDGADADWTLFKRGLSKSLAFRHVRHLRLFPLSHLAIEFHSETDPHELDAIFTGRMESHRLFLDLFGRLAKVRPTATPMPHFETLQLPEGLTGLCPRPDRPRPTFVRLDESELVNALLEVLRPPTLCDRRDQHRYTSDPNMMPLRFDALRRFRPPLTVYHDPLECGTAPCNLGQRYLVVNSACPKRYRGVRKQLPPDADPEQSPTSAEALQNRVNFPRLMARLRPAVWHRPREAYYERTAIRFVGPWKLESLQKPATGGSEPERQSGSESERGKDLYKMSEAEAEEATNALRRLIRSTPKPGRREEVDERWLRDARDLAGVMSIESSNGVSPCPACGSWE